MHLTRTFRLILPFTLLAWASFAAEGDTVTADYSLEFSATVHASNPLKDWRGESWYLFDGADPIQATINVVNTGVEKGKGNVLTGTETATLDFGQGDTFQILTRYIATGVSSKTGVYRLVQTGTITNGTGIFKGVVGLVRHTGYFGPGLRSDTDTSDWSGQYEGTMVGIEWKTVMAKAVSQIAIRPAPVGSVDRQ